MKEELITFETAKLAKELGFDMHFELYSDAKCYTPDGTFYDKQLLFQKPKRCKKRGALAPTQSLLQRWLREKHKTHICIDIYDEKNTWGFDIYNILDIDVEQDFTSSGYKSYEEALEEGLKTALKHI